MIARRNMLAAASLALCLGGVGMVTKGAAVPVQALTAQQTLERTFEQRLAENLELQRTSFSASPAKAVARLLAPERSVPGKGGVPAARITLPTEGAIGRLTVDRLGVKDIVLAGEATHDRLAQGPTLLKRGDAASPVTVLAAHRDTHFLFIRDLRAGDEVSLQLVTGETERYRVTRFETVRWDQFAYPRDPARPLLALTTCYPFGGTEYGGPLRRVAWAERID